VKTKEPKIEWRLATRSGDDLTEFLVKANVVAHDIAACRFYKVTELSPESFGRVLAEVYRGGSTEVDLLIRTGGEQRLSDFLLWECAFAEFVFVRKAWPDFTAADLEAALQEFALRERTRGALPGALAG